jgi:hypothetical protein
MSLKPPMSAKTNLQWLRAAAILHVGNASASRSASANSSLLFALKKELHDSVSLPTLSERSNPAISLTFLLLNESVAIRKC